MKIEWLQVFAAGMQLLIALGYLIQAIRAWLKSDKLLQFRYEVLFLLWMLLAKASMSS